MRVLSLHKLAKFGCFISINDKIINNLPRWGHFQPNFRWPLAAKLLIGSKKVRVVQWWHGGHGGPLSSCKIWWKSIDACRRGRMKCDVFGFFVNNTPVLNAVKWRSCVIQEKIMSVFVGQFRCGLQRFFQERKALSNGWNKFENCR